MGQLDKEDISEALDNKIAQMSGIQEFNEFLEMLVDAWDRGLFEPQDVAEYLNGIWGVVDPIAEDDSEGRLAQPVEPNWKFFATVLLRAFSHS